MPLCSLPNSPCIVWVFPLPVLCVRKRSNPTYLPISKDSAVTTCQTGISHGQANLLENVLLDGWQRATEGTHLWSLGWGNPVKLKRVSLGLRIKRDLVTALKAYNLAQRGLVDPKKDLDIIVPSCLPLELWVEANECTVHHQTAM